MMRTLDSQKLSLDFRKRYPKITQQKELKNQLNHDTVVADLEEHIKHLKEGHAADLEAINKKIQEKDQEIEKMIMSLQELPAITQRRDTLEKEVKRRKLT